MSEALQKIEPIEFMSPNRTDYGYALAGRDSNNEGFWSTGVVSSSMLAGGLSFLGFLVSIIQISFPYFWPMWTVLFCGLGPLFLALPFYLRRPKKLRALIAKIKADEIEQLRYRLAAAIEAFNNNIKALNRLNAALALGLVEVDEAELGGLNEYFRDIRAKLELKVSALELFTEKDDRQLEPTMLAAKFHQLELSERQVRITRSHIGQGIAATDKELMKIEAEMAELDGRFQHLLPVTTG